MPTSEQIQAVAGFAGSVMALAGVAVMVRTVSGGIFHHSIAPEDLRRIADEYGWWAARRAEASCPHMDVACVEREAKRLYETMIYRR